VSRVEEGDSRTITKGTEHIQSERTCLFSGDKRVRLRMADWSESKCSARLYSSQSTVFKWRNEDCLWYSSVFVRVKLFAVHV